MSSNWHHRRPRSRGGRSDEYNMVRVGAIKHYFWHRLFGNLPACVIAQQLNIFWLDPAFVVVSKEELAKMGSGARNCRRKDCRKRIR